MDMYTIIKDKENNVDNFNNLNHKCTKEIKPVKITQTYCSSFTECTKEIKL